MVTFRASPHLRLLCSLILSRTSSLTPLTPRTNLLHRNPRMQPYELIVIGSGPGGQRAAIQAVKAGKRVALIEKQSAVGGVCTNTGTIPSKTMREAVLHLSGFYEQSFYGANYHAKDQVTMADLSFRVQRVIESEVSVIQDQLKRNGVDLIHGLGTFTGPHQVRVANGNGFSDLEGEFIVLATG